MKKNLLFVANVDWYFDLHWKERVFSEMTSDFELAISYTQTKEKDSKLPVKLLPLNIRRSSINLFSNLTSLVQSAAILHQNHFDLIHTVTVKPNLYFGFLARIRHIPIVLTIPGLGTIFSSNGYKFKLLRKIILFLYRFVGKNGKAYFVFENKHDRNLFLKENICLITNSTVVSGAGIDLEKFRYTVPPSLGSKPVQLLFAARLLKGKGLDELIKATGLINASEKRIDLNVAGIVDNDSQEAIPLSQVKNWHNKGKINYLGQVTDMPELLSRSHIVALPTTYGEGLPRILLEASACGRPVITTNTPGCNDFVEDGVNGILVNPGCTNELVEAIEKLMDQKKRIIMGRVGRDKVEKEYSTKQVIKQFKDIYQKLSTTA